MTEESRGVHIEESVCASDVRRDIISKLVGMSVFEALATLRAVENQIKCDSVVVPSTERTD
jgi:hypothetical protein